MQCIKTASQWCFVVFASLLMLACAQSERQKQLSETQNMSDYFATADEAGGQVEQTSAVQEAEPQTTSDTDQEASGAAAALPEQNIATLQTAQLMPPEIRRGPDGQPLLGSDGEPLLVIKQYDPLLIRTELYSLASFGPNPYLTQPPVVTDIAKESFGDAMDALKDEKYDEAESQLQLLIDNHPTLSGPAYNMAMMKYTLGDMEKAEEYANIALNRNYYNQQARNLIAVIYREKGDFAKSEELHKKNLEVWAGYAESYRNLGVLYDLYMGNIQEAVAYYKQYNALQAEPNRQVLGWTMDIDRRLQAQAAAAAREKQAEAEAIQKASAVETESGESGETQVATVDGEVVDSEGGQVPTTEGNEVSSSADAEMAAPATEAVAE